MQKLARADRAEVSTFKRASGTRLDLKVKGGKYQEVETPKVLLIKLVRAMQGKTRLPGVDLWVNRETGDRKGAERFELWLNDAGGLVLRVFFRFKGLRRLSSIDVPLDEVTV